MFLVVSGAEKTLHAEATLGDVLHAVNNLTNEVLFVRQKLDPISTRQRVFIIAASSFAGGVFANLVLWLAGVGTILALHKPG